MSQYGNYQPNYNPSAQNLQFYPSSYGNQPVSGHSTPFQAYSGSAQSGGFQGAGYGAGFSAPGGVSGRMGEQGGLKTGWLAAFGTEGYEGEPPLLEELGVNFGHIKTKVCDLDGLILGLLVALFWAVANSSYSDTLGVEPTGQHRPALYGRLRPSWSYIILHALRYLFALCK